jgi:hypothetical protein
MGNLTGDPSNARQYYAEYSMSLRFEEISSGKLCSVTLFTILASFFLCVTNDSVEAEENLEIGMQINPDSVSVNDELRIEVVIKNAGNSTELQELRILYPWSLPNQLNHPIILNSGRVFTDDITIAVPESAAPGKYNVGALVGTNESDYLAHADLTVNKFQSINFSGEIPLSVLALLMPGILSYFIVVWLLTNKFDRQLLEIGIGSFGLGFIAWSILNVITGRTIYTISQSQPIDYFWVFLIAVIMAFAIIFLVKFTQSIINKLDESKQVQKFNQALRVKGFARSKEPPWHTFITTLLNAAKKNGRRYGLKARVVSSDFPSTEYVGLLKHYSYDSPNNVSITPKYIITCTINQVVNVLTNDGSSPLRKKLREDDDFFAKAVKYINQGYIPTSDYAYYRLKTLISNAGTLQSLEEILVGIDFSIIVEDVALELRRRGLGTVSQEYENFTFIKGKTIKKVEVLGFETRYMLNIKIGIIKIAVPKPHLYQE